MSVDGVFFISCFLPVIMAAYWLIPGTRTRNALLLIAGLVFYSFGSLSGLALLLAAAVVNYVLGLLVIRGKCAKGITAAAVTLNLAFLCAFKYLSFLLSELGGIFTVTVPELDLAVPIGISFFTFKCVSYIVDTYRDRSKGTKNFFDLLLYISFFPQVMAGPITRFSDFGRQLRQRNSDSESAARGIRRFIVGLSKKLILAGTFSKAVDAVSALDASALDIRLAWVGAIGYMLQIYFDFSGYSDMAIGLGQVFGFHTPENFDYPYIATSITDFWRRWHISLSTWFKDYLYIPLGGNRKGKLRTGLNKFIVFTLCGLWHGSAWTFLAWGAWHGIFSALESLKIINVKRLNSTKWGTVLARIYTLAVVGIGFVMFRASTFREGLDIMRAMVTGFSFTAAGTVALHQILTAQFVVMLVLGVVFCTPWPKKILGREADRWGRIVQPLSYAGCLILFVVCIMKLAVGGFAPFIYAQF